jgi:hypothetical protein
MKLPRVRFTIRWMMVAVVGASLLLLLWLKANPRAPIRPVYISKITDSINGITFRHARHLPSPESTLSSGTGKTSRGTTIYWISWTNGFGAGELIEYENESMHLWYGAVDYGPIMKGDLVDFGLNGVLVNGRERTRFGSRLLRRPHRWNGLNSLVPEDLVIPE